MLANQVVVDYFNALGHSTPEISQFYMGVEVLGARIESGRELKVRMSKATSGRILAEMDGFDGFSVDKTHPLHSALLSLAKKLSQE